MFVGKEEIMIVDELIDIALFKSKDLRITDVRAGLGYTCVKLDNDACGLAYTFRSELGCCCGTLNTAGSLIGMPADRIITWAKNEDLLRSAIGLASVNAVMNDPEKGWGEGNILNSFDIKESETFGMIGEFHPVLSKIKSMTEKIYVFEQNVEENSNKLPSNMIPHYLPQCDVIVITATSIINHTFDDIYPYCKNARKVCLLGPSTSLCPDVFRKYNITLLAGSVVIDSELILQVVSQGGGTMSMKPAVRQVLVPCVQ